MDYILNNMITVNAEVKFKRLNGEAVAPTRGSASAAGYDLYSNGSYEIEPGETVKIGTGIAMALPENTYGAVFARSGLATKQGLRPANCVGVIDSDYRGEIIVAIHNDSSEKRIIEHQERIAQLVIQPYISVALLECDELDETERGTNGFGSTGTK